MADNIVLCKKITDAWVLGLPANPPSNATNMQIVQLALLVDLALSARNIEIQVRKTK